MLNCYFHWKDSYFTIVEKVLDAPVKSFPVRHVCPAVDTGGEVTSMSTSQL